VSHCIPSAEPMSPAGSPPNPTLTHLQHHGGTGQQVTQRGHTCRPRLAPQHPSNCTTCGMGNRHNKELLNSFPWSTRSRETAYMPGAATNRITVHHRCWSYRHNCLRHWTLQVPGFLHKAAGSAPLPTPQFGWLPFFRQHHPATHPPTHPAHLA
jgi:hypothetical protein